MNELPPISHNEYEDTTKKIDLSDTLEKELAHNEDTEKTITTNLVGALKTVKESGEKINISAIEGLTLERVYSTDQLARNEVESMKSIITENYANTPELQQALLERFQEIIDTGYNHTDFFILKYKGEIISFCRFDYNNKDYEVYFGSFNVSKKFKSSGIGRAMLSATLEASARWFSGLDRVIRADCAAREPISTKYIESGFVATRYYDFHGNPSLELKRDEALNELGKFNLKGIPERMLFELSDTGMLRGDSYLAAYDAQEEIDFSPVEKYGWIITRYFFSEERKQWIVGFEKLYEDPFTRDRE